jgi:hypothetical protein
MIERGPTDRVAASAWCADRLVGRNDWPCAVGWRAKSPKRSRGAVHRNISSATMTEHLGSLSRLASGVAFKARIRAMGIRDRPTSFRSPWQNGYAERLIGSIRRECTDHLIAFNAEHLRRTLAEYATYYNEGRTHVSLGRTLPTRAQSSGSEILLHIRSSAGCTIGTLESSIRKRQDRRTPTIKLDEQQAIAVRELDPTAYLALQHGQLMPGAQHSLLQVGSWT